jgi:hypothetical protein
LFCSISLMRSFILSPIRLLPRPSLVSVYVKQKQSQIGSKVRHVTLLCSRALARYCAPSLPIWLPQSSNVLSLYVKEKQCKIRWKGRNVTLFCGRALPRCCAPSSPILLPPRFSVVSVCVKQKQWAIRWKGRMLHCYVGDHLQDVVLLEDRSDCNEGSVWWVSMWNEIN